MPSTFTKDPDATLDYLVDWTDQLATGDYIVSAAVSVDPGITLHAQTFTSASHTIWLRGGVVNTRYKARSKIWTQGNRVDERTITLIIRER